MSLNNLKLCILMFFIFKLDYSPNSIRNNLNKNKSIYNMLKDLSETAVIYITHSAAMTFLPPPTILLFPSTNT